jgi:glyoxylase-like metal-dependent hydrolase (beta-lactamase superfamily II)
MTPIQLFDPASSTFTYVLFDTITREALIIDPVDEQIERDLSELRARGLKLVWTVETHAHADHITSAGQLAEHAGARTAAPEGCGITTAAVQLKDGDTLAFGGERYQGLAYAGPHRGKHVLRMAGPRVHRRHAADQRLRPHRLPIGKLRGVVSQHHECALRAAR